MNLDSCKNLDVSGLPEFYEELLQIWVKAKNIKQNNIDYKLFGVTNISSLKADVSYIHIG